MYQPKLLRPFFYHRPVVESGEIDKFDADITSIMERMSRDELQASVYQKLNEQASWAQDNERPLWVCPDSATALIWSMIRSAEMPTSFIKEALARRKMRQLAMTLEVRSTTRYFPNEFVTGFEWHDREGSRYPARYEPTYFQSMVTADGTFCAWEGGANVSVLRVEDMSHRDLACFFFNFC